jgi:hypothetical protein
MIESRVAGAVVGLSKVGGLAGNMNRGGVILRCAADCEVVAEQTAGGLVGDGLFAHGAWITDSYVRGSVAGSPAGGLLGVTADTRILNCYVACEMIPMTPQTGTTAAAVGGLVGETSGSRPPLVIGGFWDTEVSGISLGAGTGTPRLGTGLSTASMQQRETFEQAGWDFASTWAMPEGGYPVLQWEMARE